MIHFCETCRLPVSTSIESNVELCLQMPMKTFQLGKYKQNQFLNQASGNHRHMHGTKAALAMIQRQFGRWYLGQTLGFSTDIRFV